MSYQCTPLIAPLLEREAVLFCIEKRPISRLSSVFVVYTEKHNQSLYGKSQSELHGVFGDDNDLFVFVFNERCRSNEQDDRREQ